MSEFGVIGVPVGAQPAQPDQANAGGHRPFRQTEFEVMLDQHWEAALRCLGRAGFEPVIPAVPSADMRPFFKSFASQARSFVDAADDDLAIEMRNAADVLEHVAFLNSILEVAPRGKIQGPLRVVSQDGSIASALALAAQVGSAMGFAGASLEGADQIEQIAPQSLAHVDVATKAGINSGVARRWWHPYAYDHAKRLRASRRQSISQVAPQVRDPLLARFPNGAPGPNGEPGSGKHPLPGPGGFETVIGRWERAGWPDQMPPHTQTRMPRN